jgi:hypothetical protein
MPTVPAMSESPTPPIPRKPRERKVSQDLGLKTLAFKYPREVVEALLPKLIARRGRPVRVEPLPQELHRHDLQTPGILLDIALRCTWADGPQEIVLLVEHHSAARKVVLMHVHQYYAELVARYHPLKVLPVVFVTDPADRAVENTWTQEIDGTTYVTFTVELVRLGPEDTDRLRGLRTIVAALFLGLSIRDRVTAAVEMGSALETVSSPDEFRFYLPLGLEFARIRVTDIVVLRAHFQERSPMAINVIDEWLAEAEVKAEAKGRAEGKIEVILRMVAKGAPVAVARAQIEELVAEGTISRAQADAALAKLG